jgi:hypothetical protein
VASPQLEDAVDEDFVDSIRAAVRTAGPSAEPLNTFLSVVSTPVAEGPFRDAEEFADLRAPDPFLEMLLDSAQSETDIFLDQGHPFPGVAVCPDDSIGKLSGYTRGSRLGVSSPRR